MRLISKGAGRPLGVGLLLLSALAGLGFWLGSQHDGELSILPSAKHRTQPVLPPVSRRTEGLQLATFGQMRTPPEGLPLDMRRTLRRDPFGANWALAQRLPVRVQGQFWAVPATRKICILSRGKGGIINMICTSVKSALQHGVAIVTFDQPLASTAPASRLTIGMAPDGAHAVVVHTGHAKTSAPVAHGVFVVRDLATDPPDKLTFR